MTTVHRPTQDAPDRWPAALAAAATALVVALVLFQLGDRSFWFDEAFSVGIVDRPFGDALWRIANWEVNQSPFYVLLSGWWRVGQSETFLRLLPAAFTVLAVPALFDLGRRMADARVGAVAALLLAIHPLAIEWGQQLRAYSLVLLLTIVATTLLLRLVEHPGSTARVVLYAVVAAVATYAHFFAALVIGTHALWFLLHRPPRRSVVLTAAVYGALVAPLAVFFVTRQGDPIAWVASEGTDNAVVDTAVGLTGGSGWSVLAYGLAAGAGVWVVLRSLLRSRTGGHPSPLLLAAGWLVLPVLVAAVSTVTVKPLLEARFLIVVVPALALVAAVGICRLPAPIGLGLLAAVVVVSAVGLERWYTSPPFEDWRTTSGVVAAAAGPDGTVVIEPWGGVFALRYYEGRFGFPEHEVLRPHAGDPAAGDPLVEVQRRPTPGRPDTLAPGYVTWRDRHYDLQDEQVVDGGLVVRTYERR